MPETDHRRRWSDARRETLRALLCEESLSYAAAAKRMNVTKNAVNRQAKNLGMERPSPILPKRARPVVRRAGASTLAPLPSLAG